MPPQLVVGVLALVVSVVFNLLQYKWRRDERAARVKEQEESKADEQKKAQTPPAFFSRDGKAGPIFFSRAPSVRGPYFDFHCLVTIVNYTQAPIKLGPSHLVVDGKEWPVIESFFRLWEGVTRERLANISLRGNDKDDYEFHLLIAEGECPPSIEGEFWFQSDNRTELFPVKVKFS